MPEQNSARKILLLCLCGFVYKLGATFAVLLCFSSFLKISGKAGLPGYYIGLSIFSLIIGMLLVFSRRGRLITPRISYLLNPLLAVVFAYAGLNYEALGSNGILALYVAISLYDVYFGIFFWNAANSVLTVREMRRWVGFIAGVMFSGGILLGYLFPLLFVFASYSACYLACAVLLLAVPLFVLVLPAGSAEVASDSGETGEAGFQTMFASASRHPLGAVITGAVVVIAFSRYSLSYLYSAALSMRFTDERELAGFAGAFESSLRLVSLLAQSILLPWLLKRFRPPALLKLTPLILMTGSALMLAVPGFWGLVIFQFMVMLFIRTFDQNLLNLFFNLFEKAVRNIFRFFTDGIIFAATVVLTGFLLSYSASSADENVIFWLLLLAGVFYWWLACRAQNGYLLALEKNLQSHDVRSGTAFPESGAMIDIAAEVEKIKGQPARHWPLILGRLSRINQEMGAGVISSLLQQPLGAEELSILVRVAGRNGSASLEGVLTRLLDEKSDARVVADSVEAIYKVMGRRAVPYLLPLLSNSDNRVRANSVLAMVRLSSDGENLKLALINLLEMARSDSTDLRASAVAVIGELPSLCFAELLKRLLFDPERKVRIAAVRSCQKWRNHDFIEVLTSVADQFPEDNPLITHAAESLRSGLISKLELLAAEHGLRGQVEEIVSQNRDGAFLDAFIKLFLLNPGLQVCGLMETLLSHKSCHCLQRVAACVGQSGFDYHELLVWLQSGCTDKHEKHVLQSFLLCVDTAGFSEMAGIVVSERMPVAAREMVFSAGCRLYGIDDQGQLFSKLCSIEASGRDLALEFIDNACSRDAASLLKSLARH